jgi:dienelactone hydrolase
MSRWAAALVAVAATLAVATPLSGRAAPPVLRLRVVRLVDRSRVAHFEDGTIAPRTLLTSVRYPAGALHRLPLIVFAHGFDLTPDAYTRLLDAWARAGYVVAAPTFPVEGAGAPGGASESDLVNEPGDLRFVISKLTASASPFRGLIDPSRVAVAGQSDGAEAALAAAYDPRYRDRTIDAAVILSGAPFPGFTGSPRGSPPLLAVQGTGDPLNRPGVTASYFSLMRRPKFLLWLLGATHLPPYTTDDRWAAVVDRATVAFLDRYLRNAPAGALAAAGTAPGIARMVSRP